jgi:hypothetical protein
MDALTNLVAFVATEVTRWKLWVDHPPPHVGGYSI